MDPEGPSRGSGPASGGSANAGPIANGLIAADPPDGTAAKRIAAPPQRRMFHLVAASVFPTLLLLFPKTPVLAAAAALLVLSIMAEVLRLRVPGLNRLVTRLLRPLLKKKESREITGSTYLLVSTVLAIALLPREVAVLALFFTAIGDPVAALVGERFGVHRIVGGRSLEGSAAFLAGAMAVGGALLANGLNIGWPVMALGAAAAMIMELLPIGPVDDNIKIPVGSAAVMLLAGLVWAG